MIMQAGGRCAGPEVCRCQPAPRQRPPTRLSTDDGPPGEWSPTVTQDQLPVTRPPNWDYRNLSTAIYHGVNFTEATFLSGESA